jgi:hypothetical protein
MRNLRFLNRKVLVPAVIIAVAAGLVIWGLPQAISATINQTINSSTPVYSQLPNFTGSINVGQTIKNLNDNIKVPFLQAGAIAAKQITNGTIVGGHLGVVQGYLVYTFFVMNTQTKTGYLSIVDAGNGHVLYTSQGLPISSFAPQMFGPFGLRAGGLGGFRFGPGFWHGPFGAWRGYALSQHQ